METSYQVPRGGSVGFDDVKVLIARGTYVDKSLFVKEIIDNTSGVLLITRPRRWGKSSNMSLLKTFLELEVDKEGNLLPEAQKTNPVYFTGGVIEDDDEKYTLPPLKISQKAYYPNVSKYSTTMNKLGKYPVIMLNFKDLGGSSYKELVEDLKIKMMELFDAHQYLLASDKLTAPAKAIINKHLSGETSESLVKKAIKFLIQCLYKHFGKKVWVLIDEYDSAIHEAYTTFGKNKHNAYQFSAEFEKVLKLFRKLLGSALKSEKLLEKGVVTGILRIAKANLFSELNNFTEYSVLDEEFAPYYGFTQDEVDMLCQQQQIAPEKRKEIKAWYNGYNYGGLELYNPWSIARCLFHARHELKNYWEESGSFGFLTKIMIEDAVQKEIQVFMQPPYAQENVFVNNYVDLASLFHADAQTVVSLLLHTGYLNPTASKSINDDMVYTLEVPNREIVTAFKHLVKKWAAQKLKLGSQEGAFNEITIPLLLGDVALFQARLQDFLGGYFSFRIIKGKHNHKREGYYHCLMIGILAGLHITKTVEHEKESGEGYVDTVIVPKLYQGDQAIILEYKYTNKKGRLQAQAKAALKQIQDKNYIATILGEQHIKSVLQLGIAFHQKDVAVVHELIPLNA